VSLVDGVAENPRAPPKDPPFAVFCALRLLLSSPDLASRLERLVAESHGPHDPPHRPIVQLGRIDRLGMSGISFVS
jgi:hypothetical protein